MASSDLISTSRKPEYFDYVRVARSAGMREADLRAIEDRVRCDYPNDQMMFELRMLRTCTAIQDGRATVADALAPDPDEQASGQAA